MADKDNAEQQAPVESAQDVWPGNLGQYRAIRDAREAMDASDPNYWAALIAEELAGISNLLNNISYLQRNPRS
jgi:hypothetical protein